MNKDCVQITIVDTRSILIPPQRLSIYGKYLLFKNLRQEDGSYDKTIQFRKRQLQIRYNLSNDPVLTFEKRDMEWKKKEINQ